MNISQNKFSTIRESVKKNNQVRFSIQFVGWTRWVERRSKRKSMDGISLRFVDESEDEFGGAPVDASATGTAHEEEAHRHLDLVGLGRLQRQRHLLDFGAFVGLRSRRRRRR